MNVDLKKNNGGFTLIELLVVIAIISVLSSLVFASLSSARMSARDAQRISDIRQIRIALELYRNENGYYPYYPSWRLSSNSTWDEFQNDIRPYMSKLPVDPINNDPNSGPWGTGIYNYAYYYLGPVLSTASTYDLVAQLENTSSPLRCEVKGWMFYNNHVAWCAPHNPSTAFSPYTYTGDY